MKGTVIHGPRDVRYEALADPMVLAPTDALIRDITGELSRRAIT